MVPKIRLVTLSQRSPSNNAGDSSADQEFASEVRFIGEPCPEHKCECDLDPPECSCECEDYVCQCVSNPDCDYICHCEGVCVCETDPNCAPDPDCDCDMCHCDCVTEHQQTTKVPDKFRTFFKIAGDKS